MNRFRDDVVVGDDVLGWYGNAHDVVGAEEAAQAAQVLVRAAAQRAYRPGQGQNMVPFPPRPEWRDQLANGVPKPGSRMYPLALAPDAGGGVFTPALLAINYIGRPQKPFRGERLVAIVTRSAAAVAIPLIEMFVGTDLVQATAGGVPAETFGPNSFGVRMAWPGAAPGIEVRIVATLQGAMAVGDTIGMSLVVMGETQA